MAAALLGKCLALLATLLLLYSCCFAFKIRDVGPASSASCPTASRCVERPGVATTTTTTSSTRRWHDSLVGRQSRRPPAEQEVRPDDEDGVGVEEDEDDDDDDEGVTIDSEPMSGEDEEVEEDVEEAEESGERKFRDDENAESDDDDDDDEDDEDEGDDDDKEDDEEGNNDDDDEEEDETDEKKDVVRKRLDEKDDDDDDSQEGTVKRLATRILGKSVDERPAKKHEIDRHQVTKARISLKRSVEDVDDDEDDEEKEVEKKQARVKKQSSKSDRKKPTSGEDDEEDVDEDEEDDDDAEEESTPPPRKLEKVRHADKKFKPAETVVEKPKIVGKKESEDTKQAKTTKKLEYDALKSKATKPEPELQKTKVDQVKSKPKSMKTEPESPKPKAGKAEVETAKVKVTKPETESSKTRARKPEVETEKKTEKKKVEEKPKQSTKTDSSKPSGKPGTETSKPVKAKTKTVEVKTTVAPKVILSERNDTKAKSKRRAESSISLADLNEAILRVSTFLPNFTAVDDPLCQQQGKIFLRQLRGYRLWALQMLDASAKVPSGLLRGNVNQLGDFDECLGVVARVKVDEKTVKIQGKYCLASVDLHATDPDMKLPVNLMQSRAFIRSHARDPGHFVPKFTTLNWALCLPAACSAQDARKALERGLGDYNVTSGLRFTVDVDSSMCYVQRKSQSYSKETVAVLYFYAMIVCLVIVATVRDYLLTSAGKGNYSERIIMAFSLRRTVKALLKPETYARDEIGCVHGIRSLATIALYVAHQLIPIARLPFANRAYLTEVANNPVSSILRVSLVYTDCFLLLSGLLTAYNMAKELERRGEIRWFCRFIGRFVRLTPALVVVVFWYAFIMEHTGSGPQWNQVIVANAELCKRNAWTNLLYVQNFFPFEEMCAAHTHQLALDMQLSLIVPILVFFLYYKPIVGILVIFFILQVSATLRYIATMNNYLSVVIFHGMSLKHLYKTANLTYMLALHRATPYVFGVGLGSLLHYTGKNVRIHKVLTILGWTIGLALGSWSLFSPWRLARRDYVYNAEDATHYAVIGPVTWALFLSWTIFACFTGHGGIVNKILSNYWLVVFSRISYAVYLTQFAVFFYNVGTTRYSSEFQLHRAIDPFEAATVIAVSTVLTLLFDLPMQEVKNVIMECTDGSILDVSEETKDNVGETVEEAGKDEKIFDEDELTSTGWDWQKDVVKSSVKIPQDDLDEDELIETPDYRKSNGRRRIYASSDGQESEEILAWDRLMDKRFARDEVDVADRSGRSRSAQQRYVYDSDEDIDQEVYRSDAYPGTRVVDSGRRGPMVDVEHVPEYSRKLDNGDAIRQHRRSESRGRSYPREVEDRRNWEPIRRDRSSSRGPDKRSLIAEPEPEPARQYRPPVSKGPEVRKAMSSESEDEPFHHRRVEAGRRYPAAEPRISDDEAWEEELRIRRRQFREKLASQEREIEAEDLRRRSSAEGKIALLREPTGTDNMDSWTVSRVPNISQLGSSQEPSEPEDEEAYARRRYRESAPPFRDETQSEGEESSWTNSRRRSYATGSQVTSVEDEEDPASYDFVLRRASKRASLQDLSKLSRDESDLESAGWNLVRRESGDGKSTSLGLFKRESIVKSQASEEDPEYMLPERPKLVEQEQEHPFKKAWQMQKSRSEEDYVVKDASKQHQDTGKRIDASQIRRDGGEQWADVPEETDDPTTTRQVSTDSRSSESRSSDARSFDSLATSSEARSPDSLATSSDARSHDEDGPVYPSGPDDDPARFDWPTEDEQFENHRRERARSLEDDPGDYREEET